MGPSTCYVRALNNNGPAFSPSPSARKARSAKGVLNGCLKRDKAEQNCDNFRVPALTPEWPFSWGIRGARLG
jgi:hypothetical protein